jgi:hypothetical protein
VHMMPDAPCETSGGGVGGWQDYIRFVKGAEDKVLQTCSPSPGGPVGRRRGKAIPGFQTYRATHCSGDIRG